MSLLLQNYLPALKYGAKILPSEVLGYAGIDPTHNVLFVDGDNGSDNNNGATPTAATATVVGAVALAGAGDTILIKPRLVAAASTDPVSYAENVVVSSAKPQMKFIGIANGLTQGGVPQLKVGATTTSPIFNLQASGTLITGLGINGNGGTGGGIYLNSSATTDAFGTAIIGNHIKNCIGTTSYDCRTGGGIYWGANGASWQVSIMGNTFYKNTGDVVLKGTSISVPQDVLIKGNTFQGTADTVDCHIYFGGSGMLGVTIDSNTFADVLPAITSGPIARYVSLVGTGIFSNNFVAGSYTTTGWGAARAAGIIPTTIGIVHNYSDAGLIVRQ